MMRSILLLLFLSSFAQAHEVEWKAICGISGGDVITHMHIANLLLAHDIESRINGSVIHGVEVPATQADEAIRLLRADASKRGYYIFFGEDDYIVAAAPKKCLIRRCFDDVIKQPDYTKTTDLGRFLRSKEITRLVAKYPDMTSLAVHKRHYLATPQEFRIGYDIVLELQKSLQKGDDGYRGWYQVYDNGHKVQFLGSNAWTIQKK